MFHRYSMLYKKEEKLLSALSVTNNHIQTSHGIQTNFAYHSFEESITKKEQFNQRSSNWFMRLKNVNLRVWRFKLTSVYKTSETMSRQILWKTSCPIFVLSLFSGSCQKKNEKKKNKSREESFLQREKMSKHESLDARGDWLIALFVLLSTFGFTRQREKGSKRDWTVVGGSTANATCCSSVLDQLRSIGLSVLSSNRPAWLSGLQMFDDIIFAFFALEMTIKMVAMGIYGKGTYLADSWNRLDFFIVAAGWVFVNLASATLSSLTLSVRWVLRVHADFSRFSRLQKFVRQFLDVPSRMRNIVRQFLSLR